MKRLKRIMYAAFAFLLVGINVGGGIVPVFAIEGDSATVKNDPKGPTVLPDGVKLHKTARAVPGYANEWEVTLKIEAPVTMATSDTVIVIDRSNSMDGDPLTEAKDAAEVLVDELLDENNIIDGNPINRVAVVSYGSNFSNESNGFTGMHDVAYNAIDEIDEGGGGTFTQGGLHMAIDLINSSTATYKNIILLSDGEPTYSFRINNPDNYLIDGGSDAAVYNGWVKQQTSTEVSASDFVYTGYNNNRRVGNGSSMWTAYDYGYGYGYGDNWVNFYNHGNSAIAEAGFFNGKGNLYAIYFETDSTNTLGEETLRKMATAAGGEMHTATAGELDDIFEHIAGKISSVVSGAHVHDVMGEGVYIDNATHAEDLDWDPVFTFNSETNMYEATTSYRVSASEAMLEDSAHETEEGFHRLNKSASIAYGDVTGDFPVPYVKPFFVNVKKELEGQECAEGQCMFDFKIEHPQGLKETDYSVEAGKTHRIVEPFPVGDYTLTELGETAGSSNPVAFEYYTTTYTGNQFTINEEHADHIDVTIKNTYETVDLSASKVWNDGGDQDGLRDDYDDFWVVVKDGAGNYAAMQELTSANKSYSFEDLPKNYNGSAIKYKVVEASGCEKDSNGVITCEEEFDGNNGEVSIDDNYSMEVGEGNVITNKHIPATVKIVVNKNWDDDNNRDGLRTDTKQVEFCVTGKVSGEVVYEKTCKQASSLIAEIEIEFTGLPKYNDGVEIEYMVEESEFLGYDATGLPEEAFTIEDEEKDLDVTNTHTPETISILIKKVWNDENDNDRQRPDEITVTLTGDDKDVSVPIKQSSKVEGKCDEWCVEITDLHKNKQGQPIEYAVSEGDIEGYTLTSTEGDAESGFTLTNTYEPETVTVSVDKSWNDDNNRDGIRTGDSTVTFCVTGYAGDYTTTPDCKTVLTGVGLKTDVVKFEGLLKYHDGVEIEYEVTEVNTLDGYTSDLVAGEYVVIVDGEGTKEVINTHESEKIAILIEKVWNDEENKDEIRPDHINVTLTGGDEDLSITIEQSDKVEGKCEEWCVEVTDLYKNANGSAIEYGVTEEEIEGYTAEIAGDAESGFTITNSHESKPEPDPCEDEGGCGGDVVPIVPPITPDTGVFTVGKGEMVADGMTNWIGGAMVATLAGVSVMMFGIGKLVNRVKVDKKA